MLFLVAGATDTKVRRSTGVTTANSTNIRNTVELGDQLGGGSQRDCVSNIICSEVDESGYIYIGLGDKISHQLNQLFENQNI